MFYASYPYLYSQNAQKRWGFSFTRALYLILISQRICKISQSFSDFWGEVLGILYTIFFWKKEDLEEFLPLLSQKIKKVDFEREKQRLEDELFDQSFFDRLRDQFEGEQDRAYPSLSEIRTYQQNYYNNYLILDQNYKIDQKYQNNIHQFSSRIPLKIHRFCLIKFLIHYFQYLFSQLKIGISSIFCKGWVLHE